MPAMFERARRPSVVSNRDSMTLHENETAPPAGPHANSTSATKKDLEKNLSKEKSKGGLSGNGAEVTEGEVEGEGDINYHCLEWWQVGMLMIAETISLGILSLPSVFATVGLPGGIILILGLGIIATYSGYNIGLFKMAYPHVQNQADAGYILGGPVLREIMGGAQILFIAFVAASHVLTGLIALETIANDNVCSIVWAVIVTVVSCILTLPRTFTKISYFSIVSFMSITAAVIIAMVGVGVRPRIGNFTATAAAGTSFQKGFTAATNVVFAYAGHAAFFNFITEMKRPQDYDKALYLLQSVDISMYLIVGIVIYYYVGDTATSPALGNLPLTLSRIAYGVAIPTIIIAGVINANVAAKLAMQRIFNRNSPHYKDSTKLGWIVWVAIVVGIWAFAFVVANVIPFFNDLLSVISALFASWFTYGISGIFWLYLNPRHTWWKSKRMTFLTVANFGLIVLGMVIMGCGLYASIQGIITGYQSGMFPTPFSCAPR